MRETVALGCFAMNTRFEVVLYGRDRAWLRAAAEEALEEVERVEAQLSLFRAESDIGRVNARASQEPVRVDPRVFRLLCRCADLTRLTDGAFDVTVGPLMRCWGFVRGSGRLAEPEEVEAARARVGMEHVALNEEAGTVRFAREGMMLDLGSIGKGYALEKAAGLLRDHGVAHGLLHGGTSTVVALGAQPDGSPWRVALQDPWDPERELAAASLVDSSLSVSGVHGKCFEAEGRRYGHVIDPRTGWPVASGAPEAEEAVLSAVTVPSATDADALSTALLTLGPGWLPTLTERWPGSGGLVAARDGSGGLAVRSAGWR